MRIAVVAPLVAPVRPAQPYGPHAFLVDLARALGERGHEVTVYCAAGSLAPGLRLHVIPVSPLVETARVQMSVRRSGRARGTSVRGRPARSRRVAAAKCDAFRRVFDEVDRDGADVVSQHAFDAEAIESAAPRPCLHTLHLPPIVPAVVAAVRRSGGLLAAVSEASRRDWLAAGVPGVLVLRNGVPDWDPGDPPVEAIALMAGRISPEKGTAAGVRAALRVGLRPRIVGEPYDRAYFESEVAPLLGPAQLLPTVRRETLWWLMARATVLLMPIAWEEPFGLVAAEAQMAGCPVVGYRRGALPEVVEDGVSGVLVDPDDERALGDAIVRARRLDRQAVRASARRRLRLASAVDAYEQVFMQLARGRP